jgi:vacuolar-type H+-ATPase subunit H
MAEAIQEVAEPKVELSSADEMLEMIVIKEDEIRNRIQRAEDEAQREVEEAKLDASNKKREAASVEVGQDLRSKELEKAQVDAEKVTADFALQADDIRKKGMERVEDAIKIVIEGVLPPR